VSLRERAILLKMFQRRRKNHFLRREFQDLVRVSRQLSAHQVQREREREREIGREIGRYREIYIYIYIGGRERNHDRRIQGLLLI
jgi:hypothetical protein